MKNILLTSVILCIVACTSTQNQEINLANTSWTLVSLNDSVLDEGQKAPSIQFNDNTVSGFGGCNRYNGSVEIKPNTLIFEPIASTKMMCPNNNIEDIFFAVVSKGTTVYNIKDQHLILTRDENHLTFEQTHQD